MYQYSGSPGHVGPTMVLWFPPTSLPRLYLWETFLAPPPRPEKGSAIGQLVLPRLHSPELPILPAAGEDARSALGEAKKKNLSEGFLQPPRTSFSR